MNWQSKLKKHHMANQVNARAKVFSDLLTTLLDSCDAIHVVMISRR